MAGAEHQNGYQGHAEPVHSGSRFAAETGPGVVAECSLLTVPLWLSPSDRRDCGCIQSLWCCHVPGIRGVPARHTVGSEGRTPIRSLRCRRLSSALVKQRPLWHRSHIAVFVYWPSECDQRNDGWQTAVFLKRNRGQQYCSVGLRWCAWSRIRPPHSSRLV